MTGYIVKGSFALHITMYKKYVISITQFYLDCHVKKNFNQPTKRLS